MGIEQKAGDMGIVTTTSSRRSIGTHQCHVADVVRLACCYRNDGNAGSQL
jgi:hypothetical protein